MPDCPDDTGTARAADPDLPPVAAHALTLPLGLAVVRLATPVVPRHRRDEWLAEWTGELAWAARHPRRRDEPHWVVRARLILRSVGALSDAVALRRRDGVSTMLSLDLKYATRALRRRPGFAAVVVLTLALGIGATTAVFSVINGVLLRPLPFPAPERLVALQGEPTHGGDREKVAAASSYPDFVDIRARARSFDLLAAGQTASSTLTSAGSEPARVTVQAATEDYWPMVGLRPLLGRSLQAADHRPGAPAVAVVTHDLWRTRWNGDAALLGRAIALDGELVTVVGVAPPGLRQLEEAQLFRPFVPGPLDAERGAHRHTIVGRLGPGVALRTAQAEVRAIARQLELAYPADNATRGARLVPLREAVVGGARPALLMLLGAVCTVLLVGCVNLASLFLARAASRQREMAVRAALGAGQGRLVRQWMTESFILSTTGGLAGLAVAWAGMRALLALVPRTMPRADEVALDVPVLLFLLSVSVGTGLLFGLVPALPRQRGGVSRAALREGGRGSTGGRRRHRMRHGLVVAEVALATVLVIGGALLLQGFWHLNTADPRFRPAGVLVAQVQLPPTRYDSAATVIQFYERLREELAAIPGVRGATLAHEHPLSAGFTSSYAVEGHPAVRPGLEPEARVRPVWPGYFSAVGVRLLAGRDVSSRDRFGAPGVVVVNEAFARRHFAGRDPIGQRIQHGGWWPGQPTSFEIVGVVADEPFLGVTTPADPATYFAHAQFPVTDMWVVLQADGDPTGLAPALRERVSRLDASLPVTDVRTMSDVLGRSVAEPRFNALLVTLFAAAALLIAAIGIYGVLSHAVAERTGEIGLRLALGAERGRIVRMVVGQGLGVALFGIGLGVLGALGVGRALAVVLPGVSPWQPLLLATVAAALTLVALSAAWGPARRASRVEPVVALRSE